MTSSELAKILVTHRFCPSDQVGSLINALIQHYQDDPNEPDFSPDDFRIAADYPYDDNGNLLQEMSEHIIYNVRPPVPTMPQWRREALDRLHKEFGDNS